MLKQDTERQNLNDATHQKLNQARRTAREQEKHIYSREISFFLIRPLFLLATTPTAATTSAALNGIVVVFGFQGAELFHRSTEHVGRVAVLFLFSGQLPGQATDVVLVL